MATNALVLSLNLMIKVGLTGGIATGKSLVAAIFRELGAKIIDADIISREITKSGMPAYHEIIAHFGSVILDNKNEIDRGKLGNIVFNNPVERKILDSITHPHIINREEEVCNIICNDLPETIIIVNAALLIEADSYHRFKKIILVYASEKTQIERLIKRDNLKKKDAVARIRSQMSFEKKRGFSDYIVNNDEGIDKTKSQCEIIFADLLKIKPI